MSTPRAKFSHDGLTLPCETCRIPTPHRWKRVVGEFQFIAACCDDCAERAAVSQQAEKRKEAIRWSV